MRLKITLNMNGISLPYAYSRGIQAFLYSSLSAGHAKQMHDNNNGIIKPFTFSNLQGVFKTEKNQIVFPNTAVLYVSSTDISFLESIFQRITKNGKIDIFGNYIPVIEALGIDNPVLNGSIAYRTISPVTIYTTDAEERRFYSPDEDIFSDLIFQNVRHKYEQYTGEKMTAYFNLYMPEHIKKRVCSYKGIKYTAYDFSMKIDTEPAIHSLLLDLGIGSRNAAGFGMLETKSSTHGGMYPAIRT